MRAVPSIVWSSSGDIMTLSFVLPFFLDSLVVKLSNTGIYPISSTVLRYFCSFSLVSDVQLLMGTRSLVHFTFDSCVTRRRFRCSCVICWLQDLPSVLCLCDLFFFLLSFFISSQITLTWLNISLEIPGCDVHKMRIMSRRSDMVNSPCKISFDSFLFPSIKCVPYLFLWWMVNSQNK